jgi:hypothetical protein
MHGKIHATLVLIPLLAACAATGSKPAAAPTAGATATSAGAKPAPAAAKGAAYDPKKAAKAAKGVPPEQRAVERWQLLIDGKGEQAWDYLSPGARSTKPREVYGKEMAERPVHWISVQKEDKACESDSNCVIRSMVEYELRGARAGTDAMRVPKRIDEVWIKIDEVWYFVPDELVSGGLH